MWFLGGLLGVTVGAVAVWARAIAFGRHHLAPKEFKRPAMQTCYVRIAIAMAAQATLCALSFAVPEVARLFSAAAAAFQGLALVSLLRVFVLQLGGLAACARLMQREEDEETPETQIFVCHCCPRGSPLDCCACALFEFGGASTLLEFYSACVWGFAAAKLCADAVTFGAEQLLEEREPLFGSLLLASSVVLVAVPAVLCVRALAGLYFLFREPLADFRAAGKAKLVCFFALFIPVQDRAVLLTALHTEALSHFGAHSLAGAERTLAVLTTLELLVAALLLSRFFGSTELPESLEARLSQFAQPSDATQSPLLVSRGRDLRVLDDRGWRRWTAVLDCCCESAYGGDITAPEVIGAETPQQPERGARPARLPGSLAKAPSSRAATASGADDAPTATARLDEERPTPPAPGTTRQRSDTASLEASLRGESEKPF